MDSGLENLDPLLSRLDGLLSSAAPGLPAPRRTAIERWRADSDALRFHLRHFGSRDADSRGRRGAADAPPLVAVIGGTGTGKSTMVNRLLGRNYTAASFRRTFTSGAIALARRAADVPPGWLNLGHVVAAPGEIPVRGREGMLVVVELGAPERRETSLVAAAAGNAGNANAQRPTSNVERRTEDGAPGSPFDVQRSAFDVQSSPLTSLPTLIDTPDLDGDTPSHHAQADRVFRWAQGVVFAVTPEKYQMTELWPYYRLARRYAVPAVFVMNKCEEQAVAEDYVRQLWTRVFSTREEGSGGEPAAPKDTREMPQVFVVPRDDTGYEPPPEMGLEAMRAAVASLPQPSADESRRGLHRRARDLEGRLNDQVLVPLRQDRRESDRLIAALRSMEAPAVGVDVNPLTQQLQRRLQQRSVLYLMGPQRVLERVRQAPTLIARLPRVAWDYLRTGSVSADSFNPTDGRNADSVPDFKAILADQFAVLQSRIDDVLRSSATAEKWITGGEGEGGASASGAAAGRSYASVRLPPSEAGRIAEEELAELRAWLERRWNATPRDTKAVEALLKKLPGGKKASRWTEAAPYLLAIGLASTSVMFGHIDLIILGGYGVVTWLGEKIANEVGAQTRATNARIEQRYADLAHDQINRVCDWLDRQAPSRKLLEQLERAGGEMTDAIGA